MEELLDEELLREFRDESRELLEGTDAAFLTLERDGGNVDAINSIFRAFHTVKGNAAAFGMRRLKEFAHGVESSLDELRKGVLVADSELIDVLLAAKDHLARLVEFCPDSEAVPPDRDYTVLGMLQAARSNSADLSTDLHRVLGELVSQVHEHAGDVAELATSCAAAEHLLAKARAAEGEADEAAIADAQPDVAAAAQTADAGGAPAADGEKTKSASFVRIEEARLERFFESIGDLLNFGEAYEHMRRTLEESGDAQGTAREWKGVNRNFGVLVDKLQKHVAEVRQVPIRNLFNKISRIGRDAARSIGKRITVAVEGAEQLIEKSYLEVVESPLMHIVRNAVDHGLEDGDGRAAAGKDPNGSVTLAFRVTKENYEIRVRDDGRGVDPKKVTAKALQKGLISKLEAAKMSDHEAVNLICRPGFSTKEEVTDLSGRGVGLDVVQEAIDRRRGHLHIESEVGKGTTFVLTLPRSLTTLVTESLLVEVGDEPYLLPIESLRETLDVDEAHLADLPEGGTVITVRDGTYPYRDLAEIFGRERDGLAPQAVVIDDRSKVFVLGVDRALGLQKVAVKPLRDPLVERPFLRGAAVLANGRVGLVLNVNQLNG